jgi:hypothetical protein
LLLLVLLFDDRDLLLTDVVVLCYCCIVIVVCYYCVLLLFGITLLRVSVRRWTPPHLPPRWAGRQPYRIRASLRARWCGVPSPYIVDEPTLPAPRRCHAQARKDVCTTWAHRAFRGIVTRGARTLFGVTTVFCHMTFVRTLAFANTVTFAPLTHTHYIHTLTHANA